MLSIDNASQRERAAAAAFRLLGRDLQKAMNAAARTEIVPLAIQAAARNADTSTMRSIVASGRYSVWRGIPGVAFGGVKAVTSTGTPGRVLVRGLEYGAAGRQETLYRRRTKHGTTLVARRATRQFMPDRSASPTTVYPAMEAITDQALAIWVKVTEDAVLAAFGKAV